MAQEGRFPLTSGYAFRKQGSKGSMLLRQQVLFQDRDDTEAQIFADWWLGADVAGFALAATEDADSFSGTLVEGQSLTLAATEGADTFSGTLVGGDVLVLAATEEADAFSGELVAAPATNEFALTATEGTDTASFDVSGQSRAKGGVGRKGKRRGIDVIDVIWPDDPRHPNYVGPVNDNAPAKKEPVVIKVKPAAVQPMPAASDAYDPNIAALLLLAA